MPKIGGGEIIIILVVVIMLFGAKKLPELARSLGSSAREFRKGVEEGRMGDAADDTDGQVTATAQASTTTTSTET
jgi:sec-independent protein translocase protein TatA